MLSFCFLIFDVSFEVTRRAITNFKAVASRDKSATGESYL
jgi:hypothetical protein